MQAPMVPQPGLRKLRRGGGDPYTGPVASGPPASTYAPYTTINGSRSSFIAVIVIAFLVFVALLGGGWFLYSRRRQRRRVAESSVAQRITGLFSRAQDSSAARNARSRNTSGDRWNNLASNERDAEYDDAFAMNNVSTMTLQDEYANKSELDLHGRETGLYPTGRGYRDVYAASGESLAYEKETYNESLSVDESARHTPAASPALSDVKAEHSPTEDYIKIVK